MVGRKDVGQCYKDVWVKVTNMEMEKITPSALSWKFYTSWDWKEFKPAA